MRMSLHSTIWCVIQIKFTLFCQCTACAMMW
uniref:Uncharacterized protein n=1 Tax=Rhizophora mucronata TaxID=61149 RepID=A0A2P2JRC4_RHIMU